MGAALRISSVRVIVSTLGAQRDRFLNQRASGVEAGTENSSLSSPPVVERRDALRERHQQRGSHLVAQPRQPQALERDRSTIVVRLVVPVGWRGLRISGFGWRSRRRPGLAVEVCEVVRRLEVDGVREAAVVVRAPLLVALRLRKRAHRRVIRVVRAPLRVARLRRTRARLHLVRVRMVLRALGRRSRRGLRGKRRCSRKLRARGLRDAPVSSRSHRARRPHGLRRDPVVLQKGAEERVDERVVVRVDFRRHNRAVVLVVAVPRRESVQRLARVLDDLDDLEAVERVAEERVRAAPIVRVRVLVVLVAVGATPVLVADVRVLLLRRLDHLLLDLLDTLRVRRDAKLFLDRRTLRLLRLPYGLFLLVVLLLERRALELALVLFVEDLVLLGDALRRESSAFLCERQDGLVLRVAGVETRAARVRVEVEIARHDLIVRVRGEVCV